MRNHTKLPNLSEEYKSADLGDIRRTKRAGIIADAAARMPDNSLPRQAGTESDLEAMYRFLNNKKVELPQKSGRVHR